MFLSSNLSVFSSLLLTSSRIMFNSLLPSRRSPKTSAQALARLPWASGAAGSAMTEEEEGEGRWPAVASSWPCRRAPAVASPVGGQ